MSEIKEQRTRSWVGFKTVASISLNDWNGNRVKLGDHVRVELPGRWIEPQQYLTVGDDPENQIEGQYLSPKIIEGTLSFRLSRGIGVHIGQIINLNEKHDEAPVEVGTWFPLKYTAVKWYKIDG